MGFSSKIWHPYTQEGISEAPLHVVSAKDEFLYLKDGREIIDGVSSWWTINHGHRHPVIMEAIKAQTEKLDHVIFAGFVHDGAIELADKVLQLLPSNMSKVFFSDNGSTAVEIGLKMAIQYWHNQGKEKRYIIALEDGFHGETFGAMSASARHGLDEAFVPFLFDVQRIPIPNEENIQECFDIIERLHNNGGVNALIFEPLLLGTGGMKIYKPEHLDRLIAFCKKLEIVTVADEVFTGFGRTGKVFAMDYCQEKPDIVCLAKGLSGGILPIALTVCTGEIYNSFYSTDKKKAFFHGHSFTGNPIACAAASASLGLVMEQEFKDRLDQLTHRQTDFCKTALDRYPETNPRVIGTMFAMNFVVNEGKGYFSDIKETLVNFFLENGVYLRPLGNVLYFMPPYCVSEDTLNRVYGLIEKAIIKFNGK